jgi:hypothetical protein
MQTPELHLDTQQKETARKNRTKKILQVLSEAYAPQRNEIIIIRIKGFGQSGV